VIIVPLKTKRGLNDREHHMVRMRRVKVEKDTVGWFLHGRFAKPKLPCVVKLTRVAPSPGLDDDNLSGALKACRDAVAEWIGVNDRELWKVRYEYAQRRGPYAVQIEFAPQAQGELPV
jgi:hypothetical protein